MNINFEKGNGLVPIIIQDHSTLQVLMLGYMNQEAYYKTVREQRVTFFSRSKNRLWTKGEKSGNFLDVINIQVDCDYDTILIKVKPHGATCHKGTTSCFQEETPKGFIYQLQETINQRISDDDTQSYTNKLFKKGINKVTQKVGEEAVELIIEAKDDQIDLFKNEAADLLYHYLILLKAKEVKLEDIEQILKVRNENRS